jgi:hypothetical protein
VSDHTISIPDSLYEKARRVAKQTSQRVEEVIRLGLERAFEEPLADLPIEERDELRALAYLTDDALWTIARERLPRAVQERMSILMTRNTRGTITDSEHDELTALVERGNKLTLRKAQAMKYLITRGYSVEFDDLKSVDE